MPRLIEAVRLSLGPAFLFLISAEAIAAESGLGYRIFLVRRYLAMDIILPYVAWITLLAYVMDLALARLSRAAFPWADGRGAALMARSRSATCGSNTATRSCSSASISRSPSGAFVSIVGPSGCGKSTFLRLILGQERPTRGTILLDGEPLPDEPGPDRGIVFQRYSVFPHLTVLGNVLDRLRVRRQPAARAPARRARRAAVDKAQALLEAVGLGAHRGQVSERRCRAACSSASRSPRRWRASRACCCSTSRSARSIRASAPHMHALIRPLWREHG